MLGLADYCISTLLSFSQETLKKKKEIKGHLLLGRKGVTNLDSILKSRDITLLTNVHIVKAMGFFSPVVIYGCESLIIKKAEH